MGWKRHAGSNSFESLFHLKNIFMNQSLITRMLFVTAALFFNLMMSAQTSHTTLPYAIDAASKKIASNFAKDFPKAVVTNVRDEGKETHINAMIGQNSLRAAYDAKGRFRYSVLTFSHNELDEKLAEEVMSAFPGYAVFGTVQQIRVGNKSALLILIENKKTWKRIRITEDGMDIYEEYVKPS
jgi:hypothetical protein